jgi:hypothetical protein
MRIMKVTAHTVRWACLALALLGVFQTACLRRYTRNGGIEPSFRPVADRKYENVGRATGESSSFYLFWFLPVTLPHRLEEAMENAVREKGGDNLIGVSWSLERQYWILGTVYIIRARGRVVRYVEE